MAKKPRAPRAVKGARASAEPAAVPRDEELRVRLLRERRLAVEALRRLGISPALPGGNEPDTGGSPVEEGDAAQASERRDLAFMSRERLAERINRLSAALERLENGRYGTCEECGEPIEPARQAALPEAVTCLRCQEHRERGGAAA
jgi:RNA polymerase-binding transcription factor DksA